MRRTMTAVALAAALLGIAGCQPGSSNGDKLDAYVACQMEAEKYLSAPSTADFPTMSSLRVSQNGKTWTIGGYVDAENAYGGTVREFFTCEAVHVSGSRYNVRVTFA